MNPFTSFSFNTADGTTPRTMPDRLADVLNVKEFGAKGDGATDDGPAIQAALDAAFGPVGSPNSDGSNNKGIYLPNGVYLIGQELVTSPRDAGAWIFGAGPRNTRLVYTGSNSQLYTSGLTSLLTTAAMSHSRIQGICFDVTSSNAQCAVNIHDISPGHSGGTADSWIDCAFIGATSYGVLSSNNSLGSEQLFLNCWFDSCSGSTSTILDRLGNPVGGGLVVASQNALNIPVIGSRFTNNGCGICCPTGGIQLIQGCHFSNNSDIDIWVKEVNILSVMGCYSDSLVFGCTGGSWVGCTHNPASSGKFFDGTATRFDHDDTNLTLENCSLNANSVIASSNGQMFYLRGNTFAASPYKTGLGTFVKDY